MAKKSARKSSSKAEPPDQPVQEIDFDATMEEIEAIVLRLESGDLGLGESMRQYETAIQRLKSCHTVLESAEQKISLLSGFDAQGNPITRPLDPGEPTETVDALIEKQQRRRQRRGVTGSAEAAWDDTDDQEDGVDDLGSLF